MSTEQGHPELVNLEPVSQHQDSTDPDWFQYDNQGMILPHSILGSLEDFRNYVEAKGKTGLLNKIPTSGHPFGVLEKHESNVLENRTNILSGHGALESNALEHWNIHMRLRRRQQDSLSGLLRRPAENLLMNQAHRFRETQEKREMLNKVLPFVHSGYGHGVGSEFWRLPQRYGDEMGGIAATLTKTERGIREPSAHVGLPSSIRQESGITHVETVDHASRAWDQSLYLKQQCQELCEVVPDADFQRPDIDKLEVIGSGKPFTTVSHNTTVENESKEEDQQKDMMPQSDVQSEQENFPVPMLRVCGQLAHWTGNSISNKGQVGISATIFFECLTGEQKLSHLKLHNEGGTAIFYSWQQLPLPNNFPNLLSRTKRPHFYFDSSSGVILPGDTHNLEFIFKSKKTGIQTELWQLNTHPVLLQGASIQVTLRGVALHQDKTADYRQYIEVKLEKLVTLKICRSFVYEMLQCVHTPERPSSPAELYRSEEQEFLCKNPKIYYINQPVEDLKKLWHKAKPGCSWDLSISTLQQVLLSLPDHEPADDCLTRETGLAQLNALLLQLYEPLPKQHSPTIATAGQLVWRKPLDTMTGEAVRLIHLLHLSEKDTWMDKKEDKKEEAVIVERDVTVSVTEEKTEKKGGASTKEEKNVPKSKKDSKSLTSVKLNEDSRKKGRSRTDLGKHETDRHSKEAASTTDTHLQSDTNMMDLYKRLLHQKVYALMENLVDSLCDLTDELQDETSH